MSVQSLSCDMRGTDRSHGAFKVWLPVTKYALEIFSLTPANCLVQPSNRGLDMQMGNSLPIRKAHVLQYADRHKMAPFRLAKKYYPFVLM